MNEIKITMTIPGLPEAINNLADAIRGNSISVPLGSAPKEVEATQQGTVTDVSQMSVNPTPAQPVATIPQSGITDAGSVTTQPAPVSSEASTNFTIEQLSVAGAALCEQGKMGQLLALLSKYGVQAVTQLKPTPDILNAFAAELKALGANL